MTESESGATITFKDHETVDADIIIGGDGIHPFTRTQILLLVETKPNYCPKLLNPVLFWSDNDLWLSSFVTKAF